MVAALGLQVRAELGRQRVQPPAAVVGGLAIAIWFLAATRQDAVELPPEPVSPRVAFQSTPVEPIERRVAEEPPQDSAADALRDRWQLMGVVGANGERVLVLSDRYEEATVRLQSDGSLDGWSVKDVGANYAVLVQGEDEVHFALNPDPAR